MNVSKVIIVCFRKDVFLLRSCVASIKYWHPELDIYLLKDLKAGDFDTTEIEEHFGAKVFDSGRDCWGWGWAKIAPIIGNEKERYLVLDSDTVLIGRVLDELNKFKEDFVVTGVLNEDEHSQLINNHYIDIPKTKELFPDYTYPGYGFNTGQLIVTSGKIKRSDFEDVVDFGDEVKSLHPHVFKYADQGTINYVLAKKQKDNTVSVRYHDFWLWPGLEEADDIKLDDIKSKKGLPIIFHWAGIKPVNVKAFRRYDILDFYNNEYYKVIPGGKIKQFLRLFRKQIITYIKILSYIVRGLKYDK